MRALGRSLRKLRSCTFRQLLCGSLLVLIVATFSLSPALLLANNIWFSSKPLPFKTNSEILSTPHTTYYGSPVSIYSSDGSYFCITLGLISLNPAVPSAGFSILFDTTQLGRNHLQELASQGYNTVVLAIRSNIGLNPIYRNIPFADLGTNPIPSCEYPGLNQASMTYATTFRKRLLSHAKLRANENVFILGQPRSFPNDWYELVDSVTVYAIKISKNTNRADARITEKPLPSSLFMMSRDEDFSVRVALDGSAQYLAASPDRTNFPMTHLLMITARRPIGFILYTYLVAIMPFSLLVILGLFQWINKQNPPPKAYEVAFGVGATLVAILPLHAVLVPATLPSLTRLDIVFSTEIGVLIGLSILAVSRWASRHPPTGSQPQVGRS